MRVLILDWSIDLAKDIFPNLTLALIHGECSKPDTIVSHGIEVDAWFVGVALNITELQGGKVLHSEGNLRSKKHKVLKSTGGGVCLEVGKDVQLE